MKKKESSFQKRISGLLAIVVVLAMLSATIAMAADPGTAPETNTASGPPELSLQSISPTITETGKISLSLDGLGTNDLSGIIQVDKPAGATVRKAYMAAASTGGSGRIIANGEVTIDGVGVNWDTTIPSSISSYNHWADVTSMVKSKIDAAPAGLVDFTITEVNTGGIDGEILAVIFDDPGQTTDNTIILLFGAQNVLGDSFAIGLAEPIDLSDPNLVLDLSLGISYGYQTSSYWGQHSQVDVNSNRLTTSAGGQDDGVPITIGNGGLLTVGGIGDTNANPPDPYATGSSLSPRYDDELYNLLPFVNNGDTSITVNTLNPSTDDNIFFAALNLTSATAIVGEGILLSPLTATNPVGSQHTVTATVQDDNGNPIVGRLVTFNVVSGPHAGLTGTGTTDANGQATFTYTGTLAGTDVIVASFVNSQGVTVTSNEVTKEWIAAPVELTASCVETVNPSGKNIPTAGDNPMSGQNPDGFYMIGASDPAADVFVKDTGSGMVFGPFASGTNIKYTEANGAEPVSKTIGGPNSAVDWHIKGTGDAAVYAMLGNVKSPEVSCLVPPPPK